jgi:hypothetical protein
LAGEIHLSVVGLLRTKWLDEPDVKYHADVSMLQSADDAIVGRVKKQGEEE